MIWSKFRRTATVQTAPLAPMTGRSLGKLPTFRPRGARVRRWLRSLFPPAPYCFDLRFHTVHNAGVSPVATAELFFLIASLSLINQSPPTWTQNCPHTGLYAARDTARHLNTHHRNFRTRPPASCAPVCAACSVTSSWSPPSHGPLAANKWQPRRCCKCHLRLSWLSRNVFTENRSVVLRNSGSHTLVACVLNCNSDPPGFFFFFFFTFSHSQSAQSDNIIDVIIPAFTASQIRIAYNSYGTCIRFIWSSTSWLGEHVRTNGHRLRIWRQVH